MLYTTILCATDGCAHSDRAVRYAGEIAGESGAALHIVHVSESAATAGLLPGEENYLTPARRKQRITTQMAQIRRRERVRVTPHLLPHSAHATVAEQIARIAEDTDADLIVIGTRGRGPVRAAMLGSVAQQLSRLTLRPVTVVRDERLGTPIPTGNRGSAVT